MSRFLPKTLFGRMVLIMVAGLVVAQVLSMAIFSQERDRQNLRSTARHFGVRIGEIVKILDLLPVDQRGAIAAAISSPDLAVSITALPVDAGSATSNEEPATIVSTGLRRYLGETRQFRVLVTDEEGSDLSKNERDRVAAKKLLVQVRLSDNTWMAFGSSVNETVSLLTSSRFVLGMLVRLIIVILLSLLAVRLLTSPLRTLAAAAEELGKDIHRPPLDERGPVEVRRAAHAFNTMQSRLVQYVQERTRILAAVSHDLKTPITRLRLRTELLRDVEVRGKFSKDLEEMEAMVSATLDFTRELNNIEPLQNVDLIALLESLQADAQELGHNVTIFPGTLRPARVYPRSLKRCLANLLDNALKYGRQARIVVEDSDQLLRILVCDEGPGIPESEIDKVFEPFYRIERSRNRATGGTGLGLSIARNSARAHGGDLVLRNRPKGGLEAALLLPRIT